MVIALAATNPALLPRHTAAIAPSEFARSTAASLFILHIPCSGAIRHWVLISDAQPYL